MLVHIVRATGWMAVVAALWAPGLAFAQTESTLQGRVVDAQTGDPLIGAQVVVEGTDRGAVTDVDGHYRLRLEPGSWNLRVVYLGYRNKVVTGVSVRGDEPNYLDISLQPEAIAAETIEVVISAEEERGSIMGALARQRKSTNVVSGISAEEISRAPASNAADAISRVTGTSIVEGKYVYVRGLGERYSTAQVDGASLPSPEPEKRVLPLDIFPTAMIESLFTVKSYTADLPGDFAGGLVDIRTVDIPDRPFMTFTLGSGFNENLADVNRPRYNGGDLDWLGFDDGTRGLPDNFPDRVDATLPNDVRAQIHDLFEPTFQAFSDEFDAGDANKSFGFSFGAPTRWFDRDGGYLVGISYSQSVNSRQETEFFPSLQANNFQLDFDTDLGTRDVSLGAIGSYSVNPTPTSRFSVKSIFTQSAEDEVRIVTGPFDQSSTGFANIQRFKFVERTLFNTQARLEHKANLFGDARVEWDGSWATTLRDEPDTRLSSYIATREGEPFTFNEAGTNNRFFSDLTDRMFQGGVGVTSRFALAGRSATLQFGGRASRRTRDFEARRFTYENARPEFRGLPPAQLFTSETIAQGGIRFFESTEPTDSYEGTENAAAGYVSLGINLTDALRLTTGVRVEWNETLVDTFDPASQNRLDGVSSELNTVEPLPTVTLQWDLSERQAIRVASSRTVVRPQFRELAPFRYENHLESTLGNPFLENGEVINVDASWSWFPSLGEVVTIGGFYKRLNDPIETVRLPTAGNNIGTPEPYNGPTSRTYGAEFEFRNDLGRWTPLRGVTAGANLTVATSDADLDEEIEVFFGNPSATRPDILSPEIFTNDEREMFFQSDVLLNASAHWTSPSGTTAATVLYNLVGERLVEVGTNGFDDQFEQSRQTIDVSFEHRLANRVDLKAAVANLTDSETEIRLGGDATTLFEEGRSFSLKATYAF